MKNEMLKEVIRHARMALAADGFRGRGNRLARPYGPDQNTQMLEFQAERRPLTPIPKLAINRGVFSERLNAKMPPLSADVWSAHWRDRVDDQGEDRWFEISPDRSPEVQASALVEIIRADMPTLDRVSTDAGLRDAWLEGRCRGLTDLQRQTYLIGLVSQIGPTERLPQLLAALRNEVEGTLQGPSAKATLAAFGLTLY